MPDYSPPTGDMLATLRSVPGADQLELDDDLVSTVLEEAGKLASEVIAPLNQTADKQGAVLENGVVRTSDGMREAYTQYVEAGWNGLSLSPDFGGQGMPHLVGMAVQELWHSASMAFGLCPLLNQGAVDLLQAHGTPDQKATYLPKMVSGEWTGTMNLTEPQAGSDLGPIATRAWKDGDRYRLKGQKIYISFGEHDLTENIIHLVLARIEGAPAGSRGISLFIVPKFLPKADGTLGERNDLRCVSLEHKLGLHGSPTCTMAYGDGDGAIGFLVGAENQGLVGMFTMMNNARIAVGLEGVAVAERAFQAARAYAAERVQGRAPDAEAAGPINRHPDVRRMLASMHAKTEAARTLTYAAGAQVDLAHAGVEGAEERVALLTPLVKSWGTDIACEVADTGIQVHGGMGYVEETGAAQYLRDVRVTRIYEGTNGIQAADLVFRKVIRDGGEAVRGLIADNRALAPHLTDAHDAAEAATDWVLANPDEAAGASVPYQDLLARVTAGSLLFGCAEKLSGTDMGERKAAAARFFEAHELSGAKGLANTVRNGSDSLRTYPQSVLDRP